MEVDGKRVKLQIWDTAGKYTKDGQVQFIAN